MAYCTVGLASRDNAMRLIRRLVTSQYEFAYRHVNTSVLKHLVTMRDDLDDHWVLQDLSVVDMAVPPPYGTAAVEKTTPSTRQRRYQ